MTRQRVRRLACPCCQAENWLVVGEPPACQACGYPNQEGTIIVPAASEEPGAYTSGPESGRSEPGLKSDEPSALERGFGYGFSLGMGLVMLAFLGLLVYLVTSYGG